MNLVSDWRKNRINQDEEDRIKRLLVGRMIVNVDNDDFVLDNGVRVKVEPNEGCGGCASGWYDISQIDKFEAVITSVRTDAVEGESEYETKYRIFVLAGDREQMVLEVSGEDGNGYYGTGYELVVSVPADNEVTSA